MILLGSRNLSARFLNVIESGRKESRFPRGRRTGMRKYTRLGVLLLVLLLPSPGWSGSHAETPAQARHELEQLDIPYTREAFVDSAKDGNLQAVELFLAAGMSANSTGTYGITALMWAVHNGHKDVAQTLLANGADVNARSENGTTALLFAAEEGRTEMVRLLLANGANVHATNRYGETAVELAREKGYTAIVQLLEQAKGVATD